MEMCDKSSMPAEMPEKDGAMETVSDDIVGGCERTTEAAESTHVEDYSAMNKEQIVDALAALIELPVDESKDNVIAAKHAFYAIRKVELEKEKAEFLAKGNEEAAFAPIPDELEDRFKELLNRYRERRAEQLAAHEAELAANLDKKRKILEELAELTKDTDNINKYYQQFHQLQQDFKSIGDVPPSEDKALWRNYQTVTEQFYDLWKMNKELRDYDFRKNLEAKEVICEEAERLAEEEDVIDAFKKLQELHAQWREIGPVVKELRESLWKRFKDASTVVGRRYQQHFEQRKAQEKQNEVAKSAICEEVDRIAQSIGQYKTYKEWDEAARKVIDLQKQWKVLGTAPRKANQELFHALKKSCDDFFVAKSAFIKKMQEMSVANLAKKRQLCEKAEALKDSTDWRKTSDQIIALQKEWKGVGRVSKRNTDQMLWKRFSAACDYFFENRNKNTVNVHKEEQDNLEAKKAVIERLKNIDETLPKAEIRKLLRNLSSEYQQIGHVPYKEKENIYEVYRKVLNAVCDKFDLNDSRSRLENFASNVEELSSDKNRLYRERERLVRQYEQKNSEIKTYENNLGFLNIKSKAGNSVLKEMERRIARAKEDLQTLEKKIELIDGKL